MNRFEFLSFRKVVIGLLAVTCSSCTTASNLLNPFYESPTPEALLGERNDRAISGTGERAENARAALEAMATYRRTHHPQPVNPVMQPAVVRLMWIPDHLNKSGDLVPAHYYYLKVLNERWAVQDAFELESQLGPKSDSSNVPYTTK
jgi:hypothetical protein